MDNGPFPTRRRHAQRRTERVPSDEPPGVVLVPLKGKPMATSSTPPLKPLAACLRSPFAAGERGVDELARPWTTTRPLSLGWLKMSCHASAVNSQGKNWMERVSRWETDGEGVERAVPDSAPSPQEGSVVHNLVEEVNITQAPSPMSQNEILASLPWGPWKWRRLLDRSGTEAGVTSTYLKIAMPTWKATLQSTLRIQGEVPKGAREPKCRRMLLLPWLCLVS
jgi:hypothetical protein